MAVDSPAVEDAAGGGAGVLLRNLRVTWLKGTGFSPYVKRTMNGGL